MSMPFITRGSHVPTRSGQGQNAELAVALCQPLELAT